MRRHSSYRGRNHLKPSRRYDVFDSDVKRDTSKKITWGAGSSIEVIDDDIHQVTTTDISLTHSPGFNDTDSFSNPTLPELPSSSSSELSAESLLTPAATGAMIVGMVGLSLLLYKNFTMVRTIINSGCRLLQSCFYRTRDSLKTASQFLFVSLTS